MVRPWFLVCVLFATASSRAGIGCRGVEMEFDDKCRLLVARHLCQDQFVCRWTDSSTERCLPLDDERCLPLGGFMGSSKSGHCSIANWAIICGGIGMFLTYDESRNGFGGSFFGVAAGALSACVCNAIGTGFVAGNIILVCLCCLLPCARPSFQKSRIKKIAETSSTQG